MNFTCEEQLAAALRDAAAAHHIFEELNGKDANWPEWYAAYIFTKVQTNDDL